MTNPTTAAKAAPCDACSGDGGRGHTLRGACMGAPCDTCGEARYTHPEGHPAPSSRSVARRLERSAQAPVVSHARTSDPENGPDYCRECSEAEQNWVQWPCSGFRMPPGSTDALDACPRCGGVVGADDCEDCGWKP